MTNSSRAILTVLVTTFNRAALLRVALTSLEDQHNQNFDVVIFDNGSNDETPKVIAEFINRKTLWTSVRHEENCYSTKIFMDLKSYVRTPWMTYLCDDDYFLPEYTSIAIPILEKRKSGVVSFGHLLCDERGEIFESYSPKPGLVSFKQILAQTGDAAQVQTAGLSGFILRTSILSKIYWDYPGGFFSDTRLFLESVGRSDVRCVSEPVIVRRVWSGSYSDPQPDRLLQRLEAQICFINDLNEKGPEYHILLMNSRYDLEHLWAFIRIHGYMLVAGYPTSLDFIKKWLVFTRKAKGRLKINCWLLLPVLCLNRGVIRRLFGSFRNKMKRARLAVK